MAETESRLSFLHGNVLNIAVTMAIFAFGEQMAFPYLSLYILALGGNAPTIGLINSLGTLGSVLLLPIGGYVTDRKGRVMLLVIMSYMYALSSILFILATDWRMIAIGVFFQRMSLIYTPALAAIQSDSLPPGKRGIGFSSFRAIPGLAALASPYIAGYLVTVHGVSYAVRICYAILLLLGVTASTIRLKLTETIQESPSHVPLLNLPILIVTSYKEMLKALKGIPRTMWAVTAISALAIIFTAATGPFWVVYATSAAVGLSALEWGLIILVMTGMRIMLSIPAGKVVDIIGRRKCIIVSLSLMPIPVLSFVYSKTFLQVLGSILFIEILDDFLQPSTDALVADLVPRHKRGLVNSALGRGYFIITVGGGLGGGTLALFLPSMLGYYVGGNVYTTNPSYPWLLLALAFAVCAVLAAVFIHEPHRPEE